MINVRAEVERSLRNAAALKGYKMIFATPTAELLKANTK
ncbi:MAG: hypothetical protein Ta2C_06680 [Candidatus Endomicrobiellum trichonymphae]|nr:MAG: hypothetical protein Ta2C_06680 [Candidatus Endomicrobium trichonymphae]